MSPLKTNVWENKYLKNIYEKGLLRELYSWTTTCYVFNLSPTTLHNHTFQEKK